MMSFTATYRGRLSNFKLSMKASAYKVLPESLSELTSMSDEYVREKPNDMDGTKPIKYKLGMKKVQDHL